MSKQYPIEEPFLISNENGSSVLYRGKALYSRYAPARRILHVITHTAFQPRTLVFLASPVLDYGIREILEKLDARSFLLAVQPDKVLYDFSLQHARKPHFTFFRNECVNFRFVTAGALDEFFSEVLRLDMQYDFSRCIMIHSSILPVSDAAQKTFFDMVQHRMDEYFKAKAINRLTLIKMGHGIAANFFKNLKETVESNSPIFTVAGITVKKPILIIGAGNSFDAAAEKIARFRERFFIIAVDAAAKALAETIQPDAVVMLESQPFITAAFIGFSSTAYSKPPILFADFTSQPSVLKFARQLGVPVVFYFTEYASALFLARFKNAVYTSGSFESVGSVGLSAVQIALSLRSGIEVPIFVNGLDFGYEKNFTHSKYSFQVARRFDTATKLAPLYDGANFFDDSVQKLGNEETDFFSTPILQSYNRIFSKMQQTEQNVYSLETFARPSDKTFSLEQAVQMTNDFRDVEMSGVWQMPKDKTVRENIRRYLDETVADLETLRECLSGRIKLPDDELQRLLLKNDFLYVHFPDYSKNMGDIILEQNFLNRISIEVAYFLKFLR